MLLRVKDVAQELNISVSQVYALAKAKKIPHFRIGGAIRFSEEHIQAFLSDSLAERPEEPSLAPCYELKHIKLS